MALIAARGVFLLAVGTLRGQRVQPLLRRLHERFGTAADMPASWRKAFAHFVAAMLVAAIAATV